MEKSQRPCLPKISVQTLQHDLYVQGGDVIQLSDGRMIQIINIQKSNNSMSEKHNGRYHIIIPYGESVMKEELLRQMILSEKNTLMGSNGQKVTCEIYKHI
jgi:hypothetical protein